MMETIRRIIQGTTLAGPLRRGIRLLRPGWRQAQRTLAREHAEFLGRHAGRIRSELTDLPCQRRALVVGYESPKLAAFQAPLIFALRVAGFHVSVLMATSRGAAADFYRALGANDIFASEDVKVAWDGNLIRKLCGSATDSQSLLALTYRDIPIGRFVTSTLMRRHRVGRIDPRAPGMAASVAERIAASVEATAIAWAAIEKVAPDLVCFYDRGYTPDGELFEAALAAGARAVTLNAAHKSGFIMSKRYGPANKDRHFGALSAATWDALRAMDWTDAHWETLRREVEGAYRSGTWYDEVGTQFDKRVVSRRELVRDLGLEPGRKTAVVFPHLFWDATFFWGEDLFDDYRDWYCRVLEAAAANDRMNWIVKVHPATLVKDARDGYTGEAAELVAARETLGTLPDHIKLVPPDSPISTLSLYEIMDVCLTVRGTVGLEAAMYGIPVLTAGTGRYDGYGFTVDSASREAYLERLASLDSVEPLDGAALEAARRYSYGVFVFRPLELTTVRYRYRQDKAATLELTLDPPVDRPLPQCGDIARLARWLASDEDDLHGMNIGARGGERWSAAHSSGAA